jgi:gamma-glutamyltranspeptidase/glutathione hydrolase
MKRAVLLLCVLSMIPLTGSQLPGDRPVPNQRATRSAVLARNGMIATSQPLASAAGLRVLQEGGNAIDAAVTAAAVLAVVEPTMCGAGGDLFALVYDAKTKMLRGLNASGRAPYAATPEWFQSRGMKTVPGLGILSVSVPGAVDGWAELLARHGTLPLAKALAPAIAYARDGFPVPEIIASDWKKAEGKVREDPAAAKTLLLNGRAPEPGEVFANPRLAATLAQVAKGGRDAFYRGPIAQAIVADSKSRGGLFELRDFAEHRSDWVEPISTTYRGYQVFEMPPNTQGVIALEMLNILEGFDLKKLGHNSADYLHLLVEAKRLSWADRNAYLADLDFVDKDVLKGMLSKEYAAKRRAEISPSRAADSYAPGFGKASRPSNDAPGRGDTIYMTVVDRHGNMVSLIQSIFEIFGAGVVAGDTGVVLHNRASLLNLEEGHPSRVAPHKRPFHTLVPAFAMKDGRPWLSFGVMGGDMQPQGHVQVLLNMIDFGMNVQEAGDAARFRHTGIGVALESAIGADVRAALGNRGHTLVEAGGTYGGYQAIMVDPKTGVLMGGSDPRKDGLAIGY